jgi:hypothetical protein
VVFFWPETQLTVNTRTLLLKECRPRANVDRAATIPLIAFFLAAYSVQGSLDQPRFAALWWPNFTRVVVIGQGIRDDKARSCRPDTICREGGTMANLIGVVRLLKQEQDRLTKELRGISAALAAFGKSYGKQTGTRGRFSAAARARIGAAQRARWAKVRASKNQSGNGAAAPKRTMSAAARKRIAAAQRARWAKVRATRK